MGAPDWLSKSQRRMGRITARSCVQLHLLANNSLFAAKLPVSREAGKNYSVYGFYLHGSERR